MARIQINGKTFEVKTDKCLLDTCLALGFDIPYFCFHPAMGSVGACRQCAVKKFSNAEDKKGRIVMSCMEPVVDGMIISINDPEAVAFREAVIEGLMTNHPHDCPVCDEGGECHLQDMTVMTGHAYRRFVFKKRTHKNQHLGPFIQHEMNRCIQCYRCLRFYTGYAGGTDFCVSGSANRVYFGRHTDGILESEFSGNLVEVCPTGVFTDKTLRTHYTRKWDLTNSPSVCVHCSLGCNTLVSQRYGSVRRILSRYNKDINGYFLCDRGRFGYEYVNNPLRIKKIMVRRGSGEGSLRETGREIASLLSPVLNGKRLTGIGSPRASLESNFALEMLVGKGNFFHGISSEEYSLTATAINILKEGVFHTPSLKEIEKSDALLILGEDLTSSAPMMALAVRQASRNKGYTLSANHGIPQWNDYPVRELAQDAKTPLFIASPLNTKLDDIATGVYNETPAGIARLGFEIASRIDVSAPSPGRIDDKTRAFSRMVAEKLSEAQNPVIITGLHLRQGAILDAAVNIATALSRKGGRPSLSFVFSESNSLGAGLMNGRSVDDLAEELDDKKSDTLIILENDLYLRLEKEKADRIMKAFENVIVLDSLLNETAGKADILIPCGTFAESTGTIVNNEGRAQRYYRVLPENGHMTDSWKIISVMAGITGNKEAHDLNGIDDMVNLLATTYPIFRGIRDGMPDSCYRYYNDKIARQTLRFSGRTAMNAAVNVSEPEPPHDPDSPLRFSMEGYKGVSPTDLAPYYWSPGWNSVQAMNKYVNAPEEIEKLSNPGVLLFQDGTGQLPEYSSGFPVVPEPGKGQLHIFPVMLIFGSEELSSRSMTVTERIPGPFIFLNEKELKKAGLNENETITLSVRDTLIQAEVKVNNSLPAGTGGLSVLVPGTLFIRFPATGKIEKT